MTPTPAGGQRISVSDVLDHVAAGQSRARRSLHLTPSENTLSPLARLPLALDTYSRYFFDHLPKFGAWCFYGGLEAGDVETGLLRPLLLELAGAEYVNVQPISGLNGMTVALAGLTDPGDHVVTVPGSSGGHMCTPAIAARLGLTVHALPMTDLHDLDADGFARLLEEQQPALVYVDQSTMLFPLDARDLRAVIEATGSPTLLHYDSSHLNGLVLAGVLPNPLDRGADSFGGSTHKTLPGPHKAFLATRDPALAMRLDASANTFVSHHHPGDVLSLAITLLELRDCGGAVYARQVLDNATRLARALHDRGLGVAAAHRGFTACHQVWVDVGGRDRSVEVAERLLAAGLVTNRMDDLPGLGAGLRLGTAELTKLGGTGAHAERVADVIADVAAGQGAERAYSRVRELRQELDKPRYCHAIEGLDLPPPAGLEGLLAAIARSHEYGSSKGVADGFAPADQAAS